MMDAVLAISKFLQVTRTWQQLMHCSSAQCKEVLLRAHVLAGGAGLGCMLSSQYRAILLKLDGAAQSRGAPVHPA